MEEEPNTYPFDENLMKKYDARSEGDVKEGENFKNIELWNINLTKKSLSSFMQPNRPLIISFGSYS